MSFTERLRSLQHRFGPTVWLVSAVLVPLAGAVAVSWRTVVLPAIHSYEQKLEKTITDHLNAQLGDYRQLVEQGQQDNKALFEAIKRKIVDEFDSTYYVAKDYSFGDPAADQEPLSQFFYAGNNDLVLLYIWSEGQTKALFTIKINGGRELSIERFGKRRWTNVDITEWVKASSPLNDAQYAGIGDNVYNLLIYPVPNKIQQKYPEDTQTLIEKNKKMLSESGERGQISVYALVIVRRGPFK